MDIRDCQFNVGDTVITTEGDRGKITYICQCDRCRERGFFEPTWTSEIDGDEKYITRFDAYCGFSEFYQIGKHRFSDFDKIEVLNNILCREKELNRLKKQLKVIEDIENSNE